MVLVLEHKPWSGLAAGTAIKRSSSRRAPTAERSCLQIWAKEGRGERGEERGQSSSEARSRAGSRPEAL